MSPRTSQIAIRTLSDTNNTRQYTYIFKIYFIVAVKFEDEKFNCLWINLCHLKAYFVLILAFGIMWSCVAYVSMHSIAICILNGQRQSARQWRQFNLICVDTVDTFATGTFAGECVCVCALRGNGRPGDVLSNGNAHKDLFILIRF